VGIRRGRVIRRGLAADQSGLVVAICALCIFYAYKSPYFFDSGNFANIGVAISYGGIMAAGSMLVMVCGGLDLSIAAVAGLSGQALAFGLTHQWPTAVAIGFALLIGAACGLANALLMVGIGINAIIGTIATAFIFRGLTYAWGGGGAASTSIANAWVSNLANGKWLGVPVPTFLMIGVFALTGFVYRLTRFGSNIASVGGSRVAARRAGIAVGPTAATTYVISATLAGLAGVLLVGLDGGAVPDAALGVELTVLAALVIGGTSLSGGIGSVSGALLGVFGLGVLANGLNLLGVSPFWKTASQGVALLVAVSVDSIRRRRKVQRDE
jgi:ribose/xylose/arabinose/galactoside ABC-type transport system permease subunit